MTAAPLGPPHEWPHRLLTAAEYVELGETEVRTELYEGRLLVSPSPSLKHSKSARRLANALEAWAGQGYEVYEDVDVDLDLAAPGEPGFVPRPDVVVARAESARRIEYGGGTLHTSDVVLVVEILSPSSRKMDRVVKRDEYADARIPHYWIVDLDDPVSILACHLAGDFGYADSGEFTGTFRATEPFEFELELSRLR
ncbi:MAG TPA: Uma2 family endonuclease [Pseudonocardia sp.]|jgi:Uma2 family endonuclease|uniref:Uma2 family endonuclease n=1 Tax=Pseudonocardia sp. TaxID=60912 RepID=UPI002F41CA93